MTTAANRSKVFNSGNIYGGSHDISYEDLLASVGQIPNMVYVDYSYITVGFGAYREDAKYLSEQFELMAVVDLNTWTVETVYDNTDRVIVIE